MATSAAKLLFRRVYSRIPRPSGPVTYDNVCGRSVQCFKHVPSSSGYRLLALPFIPTVYALWGKKKDEETAAPVKTAEQLLIEKADFLHAENKIVELYDFLSEEKNTYKPELLWRLARAACDRGKLAGKDPERRTYIYEAYAYIKRALDVCQDNYAIHKWYAILLDYVGEYEGTKQRIANAFLVKEHFIKAVDLNPQDATSVYSLGYWCFLFAEMPWYQRKIASVIFTSPPTSSYEEALKYFHQAEEIEPNFYSMNLLMLGKTYKALNNQKMALLFLTRARDYPIRTPDDKQAHQESTELLEKMGVKS